MAQRQVRFIKAYVMHGRTLDGLLDYEAFFQWLANLPYDRTRIQLNSELALAIVRVVQRGEILHFRFVSGNPNDIPLLYNESTGETTEAETPAGTWLARPTRVSVAPADRCIFIEGRRTGVSASNLERYFNDIVRNLGFVDRLQMDLSPLPSPSFEQEIDQLSRIREAALVISRPNSDWDEQSDLLSRLADDSHAKRAEVAVTAGRGDSLKRRGGIMDVIREHIQRAMPNLQNVRVIGRRQGEAVDRTLTLEKHQLRTTTRVNPNGPQEEQDEEVFAAAEELAETALPLVRERARQER